MTEPIISVSGLRGIVGESLTPQVAVRYARAFVAGLGQGSIVITRDGRESGPMLAEALCGGLTAIGRHVIDADVAATPTTGVLVRSLDAAGGIQISASHNPAAYNGLKLFSAEGRVISEDAGNEVIARFRGEPPPGLLAAQPGTVERCDDTTSQHLALIKQTVDGQRIGRQGFKVLLDSNHGAGSLLGRKLLEALGCKVTILGERPDGQFAHTPEPTAENLAGIVAAVAEGGFDVGFCQDPDADRLAVIDSSGRYLGEEYTLAICAQHRLMARHGPIVTNCSTSRMTQDIAEKHNVPFFHSAVGEANVVDMMLKHDALLGGEGNGGVIDPRVGLVRDSFAAVALILDAMARRELPVGKLADELPRYEIVKTKISISRAMIPAAFAAAEQRFGDARTDRMDGLRFDWPGKWLLVRASNTEPIMRVVAEAPTRDEAERLCREAETSIAATT